MKKNKLKIKKFFKGAQADARAGKAAMSPNTSVTGQVRSPQGPVDPGVATESILSFKDNLRARQRALGVGNIIPGAGVINFVGAGLDTFKARKEMGVPLVSQTVKKLQDMSGRSDNNTVTCPPGQRMQNGTCVPAGGTAQAQRLSKGGEFSFNKIVQQDYYKDLI